MQAVGFREGKFVGIFLPHGSLPQNPAWVIFRIREQRFSDDYDDHVFYLYLATCLRKFQIQIENMSFQAKKEQNIVNDYRNIWPLLFWGKELKILDDFGGWHKYIHIWNVTPILAATSL